MYAIAFAILALQSASQTRDSAGIRIVDNARPRWSASSRWTLKAEPTADIGGPEGGNMSELAGVRGVGLLRDGSIVVANGASASVRVFDARGKYLRSFGGKGKGPGEFQDIGSLRVLNGDSIVVTNIPAPPLLTASFFSSAGVHARTIPIFQRDQTLLAPGFLPNGDVVAWNIESSPKPLAGTSSRIDSVPLVILRANGRIEQIARLPYTQRHASRSLASGVPVIFGGRGHVAVAQTGFFAGFSDRYDLRYYTDAGRLSLIVRRSFTPTRAPANASARFRARSDTVNTIPDVIRGDARKQVEAMRSAYLADLVFASTLPAFNAMIADGEGNLWVERYQADHGLPSCMMCIPFINSPTNWDVFDASGTWLGDVQLPARFTPFDISGKAVAGVFRDDDDVEHVRVYPLIKPT